MKSRWRSYAKPHLAPGRAGSLACNKRVGVQLVLASARTKQLEASSNAPPQIVVVVYQRHSHTHTRAAFVAKHHR